MLKIANKKIIFKCWEKAQASEALALRCGFWLGWETSAEFHNLQNLKKYNFKGVKNNDIKRI